MKFNRVTALLLSLTLAFSLAACGQGTSLHLLHPLLLPLPLRQRKPRPRSSCWPRKTRSFPQTMPCGRRCSLPWTKT